MPADILAQALAGLGGLLLIVELFIAVGTISHNRDPRVQPKKWRSLIVVVCVMTPMVAYCFIRAVSIWINGP